jgi:hypothetical protein
MSLPYYEEFGWKVEVVTVKDPDNDTTVDPLLVNSIPHDITVHYVSCLSKKHTTKIGLGSIALRSLFFYKKKVNQLLKTKKYDLIFFSTTQFPLCILGAYWKKKFKIPYVIDMQDPWHSNYYQGKKKDKQPKKYWFSYYMNKYLEPIAMKSVDGIMAVSEKYIEDLAFRYANVNKIPTNVITFGYSDIDLQIAIKMPTVVTNPNKLVLAYVGVLGQMMQKSLNLFFDAINKIIDFDKNYYLNFKGTSYANSTIAIQTAIPLASQKGVYNIEEDPKRMGIFEVLNYLKNADGLIIFGTDDAGYTSSKLYPYIQSGKPILGIFHPKSNAIKILSQITNAHIITLTDKEDVILAKILAYLNQIDDKSYLVDQKSFSYYSASEMTERQCELFDNVLINK